MSLQLMQYQNFMFNKYGVGKSVEIPESLLQEHIRKESSEYRLAEYQNFMFEKFGVGKSAW